MNNDPSSHPNSGPVITIRRIADDAWHALDDEQIVGHGDVSHRPDGRDFISIDAWHPSAFDRLAAAMLPELRTPLYTLVDGGVDEGVDEWVDDGVGHVADHESASRWRQFGFAPARREWELAVPTDPQVTGLGSAPPLPAPGRDLTIVPAGQADEDRLRALDRSIRAEVEATVGWQSMPAEVLPRPAGVTVADPSKYAVAQLAGHYVGLVRVSPVTRRPRIGLIAVRSAYRRRGIGRALLAHTLGTLHRSGITSASAEVDASNVPAAALFAGLGAQRIGSNLELVRR